MAGTVADNIYAGITTIFMLMVDEEAAPKSNLTPLYLMVLCIAVLVFSLPFGMFIMRFLPPALQRYYTLFPAVILILVFLICLTSIRSGFRKDRELPAQITEDPGNSHQTKRVWLSAILSCISPGAGQIYCGQFIRGIAIMVLTAFGLILYFVPGIIIWLIGIADAARTAQKVNTGIFPYTEVHPIMLAAVILGTITLMTFALGAGVLIVYRKEGVEMIGSFLGMPS